MAIVKRQNPALATRLCFAAGGFALACWAPLVPFAKSRLGVDEGTLGLLLLCLGGGSVAAMPLAGIVAARFGSRPIMLAGGYSVALLLPLLAILDRPVSLAAALLAFGAGLGALDVAMNLHAVEVEKALSRPLMSGFHALFSIGGFAGSGFITFMLSSHFSPVQSASIGAIFVVLATAASSRHLLRSRSEKGGPWLAMPHGIVLIIALLAFVMFLIEGALLDWSALLLVTAKMSSAATAGIGYMLFSVAMTVGRLMGDRAIAKLGSRNVFLWGGLLAVAGFGLLLASRHMPQALCGFVLIGLGAANIVPTLFRQAGNQRQMPTALALAAVTGAGYAGMLMGPALVGFTAHAVGLHGAFIALALMMCLVPALYRTANS